MRLSWRESLPIVARELHVASKRRVTYRLRWIVALVAAAVLFIAATVAQDYSVEVGEFVFWSVSGVMLIICAAAGLLLTVDSISREKRDGTLGLLFLTRLTSVDIVLGKLTAGALSGASVAFSALPFLAFSLCLGGVTARDFWQMSAALLFLLAYALTLGIFLSALFKKESVVSLVYCFAMAAPLALSPLAVMKSGVVPPILVKLNPMVAPLWAMDSRVGYFSDQSIYSVIAFQTSAIAAMLIGSFIALPWSVRTVIGVRPRLAAGSSISKLNALPFLRRKGIPESNPVYFLSRKATYAVALFLLCAGLFFVVRFAVATAWEAEVTFVLLMAFLPKLFVLWHASGAMALERQTGFLESLLTTPLTGGEVLRGKMAAIKWQIAPALLFALFALWATSTKWWAEEGSISVGATLVFAAMITLLVDIHTIGWVGLWQGLTARDRRRALVWATVFGVIGPWIPAGLAFGFLDWIFDEPRWMTHMENVLPPAMISANVFSFAIACFAMARIHEKFRATATQTWAARESSIANVR